MLDCTWEGVGLLLLTCIVVGVVVMIPSYLEHRAYNKVTKETKGDD